MAVIKAVSSKAGIGQALDYVTKEEKTEDKLVSGLHCEPDTVKDEMQATKELWGKTGGRTYKHFVHSYHEDEHITPEQAHKNAIELAKGTEAWKGHEVLIATHIDRGHIHTHFIVNSVNFEDGHKLQWSKADLQNLKDRCNEQSRQQGLHVPEKGKTFSGEEREETVAWNKETYNLLKQAEKGEVKSYVQDTALAVMDCRETATSREDFIDQMKARGYGVDWQDSHKYITFTDLERQSQGEKQCKVRNNKLEKYYAVDFGKESLEHGFEINARREAERTATTERARQQLDRTAVAENSGADERARARQLLDRTAVAEDSRTGKAYQPDNTAVTEERLSNLRSYQPSRGMESQGRPGTDQGKRPGTETTGRTTEPQKDLAEERLASLRSHKPSRGMEEPSREIGDTDTETLIREARAGIDSSRTREENSGADRANYYDGIEAKAQQFGLRLKERDETCKGAVLSYSFQCGSSAAYQAVKELTSVEGDEEFLRKIYALRTARYPKFASRYERELQTALALLNSFLPGTGEFICPVDMRKCIVTSEFGEYRSPSDPSHNGIDLASYGGIPVPTHAIADGVVEIAGFSPSAGNWVVIDHGNGIKAKYMHHSSIRVAVGQKVRKGEQIGNMGSTGQSTGVHLHLQVELNGVPVNPRNYITIP